MYCVGSVEDESLIYMCLCLHAVYHYHCFNS